jgi:hypothetical protein
VRNYSNVNPEWGYVAPAPSVMRMARSIALAGAIGATVGVATVFSLLDRPVADESVAARTLVAPQPKRPVMASTSVAAQQPTEPQQVKSPAEAARPQPNELATISTPPRLTSSNGLSEAPAVKESPSVQTSNDAIAIAADPAPAPKPQTKKPRMTARSRNDASRYYDRYFDGPQYGHDPHYGYEPRYGSRRSFVWEQYY